MRTEGLLFMVEDRLKRRYYPSLEAFAQGMSDGHCHVYDPQAAKMVPRVVHLFFREDLADMPAVRQRAARVELDRVLAFSKASYEDPREYRAHVVSTLRQALR